MHRYVDVPKEVASRLLSKYDRCQVCGERPGIHRYLTIDHIVPKSKGGTNDEANLRVLCNRCNSGKKDLDDEVWGRYYARRPDRPALLDVMAGLQRR